MECLITNGKQYIRLDSNGTPQTCGQVLADKFPEDKVDAKEIIKGCENVNDSVSNLIQEMKAVTAKKKEKGSKNK